MTPLEKAKANEKKPKPCNECPRSERVNGVLYCQVSGKIILPRFEDLCLCGGKRLERSDNGNQGNA